MSSTRDSSRLSFYREEKSSHSTGAHRTQTPSRGMEAAGGLSTDSRPRHGALCHSREVCGFSAGKKANVDVFLHQASEKYQSCEADNASSPDGATTCGPPSVLLRRQSGVPG